MALAKSVIRRNEDLPARSARQPSNRPLLTAKEVAEITGLSVETLAQWRSQRKGIPYVKISRNCVRYRPSDLDVWLVERIVRTHGDAT
jgi:predicted DNA-binding transcriptional regulator AlpA